MDNLPEILAEPRRALENCLIVHGNLNDFEMVDNELRYRPAYYLNAIFRAGDVILSLSKSMEPKIYRFDDFPEETKKIIEAHLRRFKLFPLPQDTDLDDPQKLRIFLTKLRRVLLEAHPDLSFWLHLGYGENLYGNQPGMEAPEQLIMLEFLHSMLSPAFRKAKGNMILIYHYDGAIPEKLKHYQQIEIPFPDKTQTRALIDFVSKRKEYAALAPDLSRERLGAIVPGLPLRTTERMFRLAAAQGKALGLAAVIKEKRESTIRESENILAPMDGGELTSFDQVIGVPVPKGVLARFADSMKAGRVPSKPICLVGPAGTCKTLLIYLCSVRASANCMTFELTKGGIIGDSERRIRKGEKLAIAAAPTVLGFDEIDKVVPNNQDGSLDGNVSNDQLARLQFFLAREDLPELGVFVMATSNRPNALGTALQDRFLYLPVLGPTPNEIPELLRSFVQRRKAKIVDDNEGLLLEAGELFYQRSTSPRQMYSVIREIVSLNGPELTCKDIAAGADDYIGETDPLGTQLAILQSVSKCSFRSWLPWAGNQKYPLPSFLKDFVDLENNMVDKIALNKKIQELSPFANL